MRLLAITNNTFIGYVGSAESKQIKYCSDNFVLMVLQYKIVNSVEGIPIGFDASGNSCQTQFLIIIFHDILEMNLDMGMGTTGNGGETVPILKEIIF